MKFIIGKKMGMSRTFDKEGNVIPVTVLCVGPCFVTQIKTEKNDGYNAVQIGYNKAKKLTKPKRGHLDKANKELENLRFLKEFKVEKPEEFKLGQKIDVSIFQEGDKVAVSGISKGRGFAGVVKRHGFHGAPKSHGHRHDLRAPGSIGSAFPEHVFRGMKMAGRYGVDRVTIKNLEVVKVDKERNLLVVKGAVAGARNSLVQVEG